VREAGDAGRAAALRRRRTRARQSLVGWHSARAAASGRRRPRARRPNAGGDSSMAAHGSSRRWRLAHGQGDRPTGSCFLVEAPGRRSLSAWRATDSSRGVVAAFRGAADHAGRQPARVAPAAAAALHYSRRGAASCGSPALQETLARGRAASSVAERRVGNPRP
jgi:hypothetical protein